MYMCKCLFIYTFFYHLLPLYLLTYLLPVIPASVVHPLAQELNGRLGTVRLQHGHVKVVNKEDEVFSQRRTKNTLPSGKYNHNGYNHETIRQQCVPLFRVLHIKSHQS